MEHNNEHKQGAVMSERRGQGKSWDEMDDHERIEYLKRQQDRIFDLIAFAKDAIGLLWSRLVKFRGGGGNGRD